MSFCFLCFLKHRLFLDWHHKNWVSYICVLRAYVYVWLGLVGWDWGRFYLCTRLDLTNHLCAWLGWNWLSWVGPPWPLQHGLALETRLSLALGTCNFLAVCNISLFPVSLQCATYHCFQCVATSSVQYVDITQGMFHLVDDKHWSTKSQYFEILYSFLTFSCPVAVVWKTKAL